MRQVALLAVLLSVAPGIVMAATKDTTASTPESIRRAAVREGWPDTRAGELAYGWVTAFSTSEEAMKEFMESNLAPKSLESSDVPKRIVRYRELRKKYGKLTLASVVNSSPEKLTVKLMSSDATRREFIFAVQPDAPYKLVSVSIREAGPSGHGGFGHGGQ